MKTAAVLIPELHHPPVIDDVVFTGPGDNEVAIDIKASGLCHTDISWIDNARETPCILGHEGAGIISAVGKNVRHLQEGDHVAINWRVHCGQCQHCRSGRGAWCENALDTEEPRVFWQDAPIHTILSAGTFCKRCIVPAGGAVPIRKDMPFDKAALLGCGVATGIGAALYTAQIHPGDDVVIIGAGGVGMNIIQGARLQGAGTIIIIDLHEEKLTQAKKFGATDVICASTCNTVDAVLACTNGRGAEHVFDVTGLPSIMENALQMLGRGGQLTCVGVPNRGDTMTFEPRKLISMQQTICGCTYGDIHPGHDLQTFAQWYMQGRIELDSLVTKTINLEELLPEFTRKTAPHEFRTVVTFE